MQLDPTRSWWAYPIVIVDFETTGIDPLTCAPVSVAAVRYEQGKEVGAFYSLVRPGVPIPDEAAAIHHITDAMVADAPEFADVVDPLAELGRDAAPCAFNAVYDRTLFHQLADPKNAGSALPGTVVPRNLDPAYFAQRCRSLASAAPMFDLGQRWICPLVMLRKIDKYVPGKGRHKLVQACARWGKPLADGDAHNALADVRATGHLLWAMVDSGRVNPRVTLGRMLAYIDEQRRDQDAEFTAYKAKMAAADARAAELKKQGDLFNGTGGANGD